MIFSDFEAHVRAAMNDSIDGDDDSAAIWGTTEIARYLNEAIRDYSQHFPRQMTTTISVVAGTRSYDLPADILWPPSTAIRAIFWQRAGFERDHMAEIRWEPGVVENISVSGTGKGYLIWDDKIYLEDEPSARDANYDIELWYYALQTECDPTANDLGSFVLTVSDADTTLLFWYTTALMMGKLESEDAYLRQYADRGDLGIYRDDSPPRKSASWRMARYNEGIAARAKRQQPAQLVRRHR
jgi:hypothetical protein